jgi:membrane carboxypeptidase/penicillin-binding protein
VIGQNREEIGDLVVVTSLDAQAQRAAERSVRRRASALRSEGAMVAIDPRNGDIRAMVGGRTYVRTGFNRAVRAKRQPGSSFKPFVYAAALASGLSPGTMVDDQPVEVVEGGRVWAPRNFGDEYQGTVTLRRALMKSSNAATVRLSQSIGPNRVINEARMQGISSPLSPRPSLALGAFEVTPLELASAYAPFANGGYRVGTRLVRRIAKPDGTVLWTQEEKDRKQVLDPRVAYELTAMLRAAVDYGTGRVIRDMGVKSMVAGKTGTTNGGTDVWFVGYTPTVVAAFWFGHDDPRSIGGDASGGRLAAPAWAEWYERGWREKAGSWQPPEGMVPVTIDPTTGELANEWCPTRMTEYYRPEARPTVSCRFHMAPPPPEPEYFPMEEQVEAAQQQVDSTWNDVLGRVRRGLGRVFGGGRP